MLVLSNSDLCTLNPQHTGKFIGYSLLNSQLTRTILYPLLVVKTRLQVQKQTTVYTGSLDAFKKIYKNEGLRGLYRGTSQCLDGKSSSMIEINHSLRLTSLNLPIYFPTRVLGQLGSSFLKFSFLDSIRKSQQFAYKLHKYQEHQSKGIHCGWFKLGCQPDCYHTI